MSERFEENQKPVEFGALNINGERYEVNTDNTALYRHLGRFAIYDHVFVRLPENRGAYVWNSMNGYDDLATAAVHNGCELHLNLKEASELDINNFTKYSMADLDRLDHFPEEWLDGEK